jgi:hypothetical protein
VGRREVEISHWEKEEERKRRGRRENDSGRRGKLGEMRCDAMRANE